MEIAALTAFLAPVLGALLKGTRDAAAEAAERVGHATWDRAVQLWGRLSGSVASRPAAQEAVEDVADNPENTAACSALSWQLEKILAADAGLRQEIERLWSATSGGGGMVISASGERSVAVHDAHHTTISTGDTTNVSRPSPRSPS